MPKPPQQTSPAMNQNKVSLVCWSPTQAMRICSSKNLEHSDPGSSDTLRSTYKLIFRAVTLAGNNASCHLK